MVPGRSNWSALGWHREDRCPLLDRKCGAILRQVVLNLLSQDLSPKKRSIKNNRLKAAIVPDYRVVAVGQTCHSRLRIFRITPGTKVDRKTRL